MKAIEVILNKLDEIFAPLDAEHLEKSIEDAFARKAAMRKYQSTDEYKDRSIDYSTRRNKAIAIAGGKYWFELFDWGPDDMKIKIAKKSENTAKARNVKISKKLVEAGIVEVKEALTAKTHDGFEGTFKILCDNDVVKTVIINVIIAGGYNVQCAHYRVLTSVK